MAKLKLSLLGLVLFMIAAGPGYAQTVSIVSGQGQVNCSFLCSPFFDPLVVVVKNSSGAPMPGQTVTWTVSGVGTIEGSQQSAVTITDAEGLTRVTLTQTAGFGSTVPTQSAVTATVGTSSVVFYGTTSPSDPTNTQILLLRPTLITPMVGDLLTGQAGQPLAEAVQVLVGVSNVALRVEMVDNASPASVSCVASPGQPEGVVLSNASGTAICNLLFAPRTGTGQFRVVVGGDFQSWGPFSFETTPGLPCIARITAGNNQSGNAGQALAAPLTAEITDCGGNTLPNIPVSWTITAGAGNMTNTRNTSDANGRVSTNLTLGSQPGAVNVRVAVTGTPTANNQTVAATFTANVNLTITQFQKLSGDTQDAAQNAPFANPLVVQVNDASGPVSGVTVNFTASGVSGTVATPSAVTNAQGRASTTVTAGPNVGTLTVTASIGTLTQQFTLTVRPPGPSNVTFENGAGFQRNFIAPCGIATIRGSGLATGVQGVIVPNYFGPMPLQVANATVQFGERYAPIYNVANQSGQESITVQVPCETVAGTVPVTIKVGGGSAIVNATVSAIAPGIFETAMSDGRRRAAILKPDGSYASLENPVRKGEIARMYVTGLGTVTPAIGTNSPGIPDVESVVPDIGNLVVGVNNGGVRVINARYAAGLIGVYEVTFQVPSDVPNGNLPLAIAVYQPNNSLLFGNPSQIPVQ